MNNWKFFIPPSDLGTQNKLQTFRTGAAVNLFDLGYDAADLDEIIAAVTDFSAALTASDAAKNEARNKVLAKDETKRESVDVIRAWAQRVKTNPLATPEILASFGIQPATPSAGPVVPPIEMSATPTSVGNCVLKWKSNGNVPGTTYVIEKSTDGVTWEYMVGTTKKRFNDLNAPAGVRKFYRVSAQRAGQTSLPGTVATIYPYGSGEVEVLYEAA